MVTLVIYQPSSHGASSPEAFCFELADHEINIGRGADNHIVLDGKNVSKYHAKVWLEDDKMIICDLYSKNGLYILNMSSEARIFRHRVSNAEIFKIGNHAIQIYSTDKDDTSTEDYSQGRPNAEKPFRPPALPPRPMTPRMLRNLMGMILRTKADVDALCIDYFPETSRRAMDCEDRQNKINLLIEFEGHLAVYSALIDAYPREMSRHIEQMTGPGLVMSAGRGER